MDEQSPEFLSFLTEDPQPLAAVVREEPRAHLPSGDMQRLAQVQRACLCGWEAAQKRVRHREGEGALSGAEVTGELQGLTTNEGLGAASTFHRLPSTERSQLLHSADHQCVTPINRSASHAETLT